MKDLIIGFDMCSRWAAKMGRGGFLLLCLLIGVANSSKSPTKRFETLLKFVWIFEFRFQPFQDLLCLLQLQELWAQPGKGVCWGRRLLLGEFFCKYFLSIFEKIYLNIWKGGWAACLSVYEYFQYFICEYLKYFVCEYFKHFVCMQVFCKYCLTLTKNSWAAEGAQRGGNCGQGLRHLGNLQHGWRRWDTKNAKINKY